MMRKLQIHGQTKTMRHNVNNRRLTGAQRSIWTHGESVAINQSIRD